MVNTDNLSHEQLLRLEIAIEVCAAFRKKGFKPILYGGATVELYTQGLYSTGDVGLGFLRTAPNLTEKNEVMSALGCRDSVRLFKLREIIIDLGGAAEFYSNNFITITTPQGSLRLESPEESLARRLLYSIYPSTNEDQLQAAKLLIAQALSGNLPLDWTEARRVARLPGFKVEKELLQLVQECSQKLNLPLSDELLGVFS